MRVEGKEQTIETKEKPTVKTHTSEWKIGFEIHSWRLENAREKMEERKRKKRNEKGRKRKRERQKRKKKREDKGEAREKEKDRERERERN